MWWVAAPAEAHVGDIIGGIDLTVDGGRAQIEASYGFLVPAEGDGFDWICHEAVTEPGVVRSPRYAGSRDGGWLAWIPDPALGRGGATLFRSVDGCSWPAVVGPGLVTDASFDPADGRSALVTTATTDAPNAVWTSSDGGETFAPAFPPVDDRRFQSVAHGTDEVWATATDDAGERLFLWHRPSDGLWAESELAPEAADLRILTPGAPGEVWLVRDPFGADTVLRATADGRASVAWVGDGAISDAAWDGTRLWVVQDGVFLRSIAGDGTVDEHPAYPIGLGVAFADGALWTAPQSYLTGALLARSTDGAGSFETLAWPDDVLAPLSCPADSEVATICGPLWALLLPRIRGFDEPPVDTAVETEPEIPPHLDPDPAVIEEPGCGCASGRSGGWVLLVAALIRRNRAR